MKILLDARPSMGGMARYISALHAQLTRALPPGEVSTHGIAALKWGQPPGSAASSARRALRLLAGGVVRVADDHVLLPRRAACEDADLFHATFNIIPRTLRIPSVITVYDLWPIHHLRERPFGWRRYYERNQMLQSIRRASRILPGSRSIGRELMEFMDVDASRVIPVYPLLPPPPDPDPRTPERHHLPERFTLSVGTLEPRKNLSRMIEAQCAAYPRTGFPLILAGARGWRDAEILRAISAAGPAVRWLGYVPDAELAWLETHTEAMIQFSRYEGFDYPVAEALRAGCALVLSNIEIHREIAGETAVYVPPDDPGALTAALTRIPDTNDAERARASERARNRFSELFPADAIRFYLDAYRGALESEPATG
ncbi:MAG: glycosyltransferase family 4 protein [Kiritimatiellae bacterium]|nr:glycosyltransferase family 4 protein [Kiritimatiellia bacterium]